MITWFEKVMPDGILLTGGNDYGEYIERDITELITIEYAKENLIPILTITGTIFAYFSILIVIIQKKHLQYMKMQA